MTINIVCVLKSGGDFDERYVRNLFAMVKRQISDFKFTCLTDCDNFGIVDKRFCKIPLKYNYPGWWSKFEVFRIAGPAIYFDLDTVILGSLDEMINLITNLKKDEFVALKAFNHKRRITERTKMGSGIMAWNGDFTFVLKGFNYPHMSKLLGYTGDQDFISEILRDNYITIKYWQDLVSGIYSYKRHILGIGLPQDVKVICFHGKPRPHQISDKTEWIRENWCDRQSSYT